MQIKTVTHFFYYLLFISILPVQPGLNRILSGLKRLFLLDNLSPVLLAARLSFDPYRGCSMCNKEWLLYQFPVHRQVR